MDAREEFSPSPDRSINRVAPPPLRSDSKFGKGKGAVSGSNLPIDRSVGTRLLPSAIVSRQDLPRDSDPRELPQEDVDGDCVVEGTEEIVPAREKGDLAIERRNEGDCAANEIRRDRATIVDGTPDGGVDDRLIGPMGKIRRLTPLCYRHDGAIGQLLDLPSKLARPSVVQGQIAHPNTIGPQDTFWKDVPKVVVLNQQTWASFDRQRISCQQKRIAKVDWSPDVPCVTTTGKRMKLPLMGHIPKAYPSYSELLRTQLRGESFSSMAASEGEDAEPQRSPAKETVIGGGDVAASDSVVEGTDISTADAPSVEGDHSTSEADGSNDPTEMGLVGSIGAKRKEPTDGNFLGPGGKIQKRSRGPSPLSLKPWGGLSPPSDRFSLVSSEHWTFCHDKDSPFVSDPDACAELVRRIRGGSHLMPETSELAFPDGFIASAQADVEAAVRKNQLILDYELSLRRMASDFAKAEAAIESKDAEIEKSKRVALDKAKEMIAERSRYHREHKLLEVGSIDWRHCHVHTEVFYSDGSVLECNNKREVLDKHLKVTGGKVYTRFPPEPNGYLHIGHAKAMFVDFGLAKKRGGFCYLRYDDTNPEAEKKEYINHIEEIVNWMGWAPFKITYTSDYFQELYDLAVELIRRGHAYVDHQFTPHPHAGDKWCIYPTYDFAHCIVDSLDFALCTLKFETRRASYYWLLHSLDLYMPYVWEYSRLNITNTVMSKRKLNYIVTNEHVDGWDDPRLLTLAGLRRRGVTPTAINGFVRGMGITRSDGTMIHMSRLEHHIREELNKTAPRAMVVLNPLKVVITNLESDKVVELDAKRWPDAQNDDPSAFYKVSFPFSRVVYIDQSDFRMKDSKGYYGLAPGKSVLLRYGFPIKCTNVVFADDNETIREIHAEYDPEKKTKPKGVLHWVAESSPGKEPIKIEVRLFEKLFNSENPAKLNDKWLTDINPNSKVVVSDAYAGSILKDAVVGDRFQFERLGYFAVDKDSEPGKLVFNRTVTLRDSYGKGGK
ncbi:hypothetical protein Bca4012_006637 [Brassica carinata]